MTAACCTALAARYRTCVTPPADRWTERARCLGHSGIYSYSRAFLRGFGELPTSMLEEAERLEQLRWLEAGPHVHSFLVEPQGPSVDTAEQLARVRTAFALREGLTAMTRPTHADAPAVPDALAVARQTLLDEIAALQRLHDALGDRFVTAVDVIAATQSGKVLALGRRKVRSSGPKARRHPALRWRARPVSDLHR